MARSGAGKEPERLRGRFDSSRCSPICQTPPSRLASNRVVSVSDEEEEEMLMEWFTLNHERHVLVRRDMELGYL